MTTSMRDPRLDGHQVLLASSRRHLEAEVEAWLWAADARGEKILTLAAPPNLDTHVLHVGVDPGDLVAGDGPRDGTGAGGPGSLMRDALQEGFDGLSIVVWADRLVTLTSSSVHTAVETTLMSWCGREPVSALCIYDRGAGRDGIGTDRLDAAVARHPDGLREQQLDLHCDAGTLHVCGAVDVSNLDILAAAIPALAQPPAQVARIDLSHTRFLSAAALRALPESTAPFRDRGGRVELHNPTPHIGRLLRLLRIDETPGISVT